MRVTCLVRFTVRFGVVDSDRWLLLLMQSSGILRFLDSLPILLLLLVHPLLVCLIGGVVTGVINPESVILLIPLQLILSLDCSSFFTITSSSMAADC